MTAGFSAGAGSNAGALEIRNLSKRFDGALALDDVSLSVARGEVHGLLGSNGSGKSTLIKVLAGFHTPQPGATISLYGEPLSLPVSGPQARQRGLAFVHQHLGLIPSLTVTENLYLGKLATADNWNINWDIAHQQTRDVFARFALTLDPTAEVGSLSAVQQALLAIIRAFVSVQEASSDNADRPGVLILDEPTPFLPASGVEQLFDLVRQCTKLGASVIFVSHDIDEVLQITDRATVLRDGQLIDTVVTAQTSHSEFVERIIGHQIEPTSARKTRTGTTTIEVKSAASTTGLGPLSFSIGGGETLGVTGLIGSGFDDLPALLYGSQSNGSGELHVAGRVLKLARLNPEQALKAGVVYLPADRLGEAGVGSLSVADNMCLPVLAKLKTRLRLRQQQVDQHALDLATTAGVKPLAPALPLAALSGGNAQKALMAKWLQVKPQLLLLNEPTQGVDVGAREQIWAALASTAEAGAAILVASTDYDQLAQICDRVLIFSRGQIVAELTASELNKKTIAEYCYRSMSQSA